MNKPESCTIFMHVSYKNLPQDCLLSGSCRSLKMVRVAELTCELHMMEEFISKSLSLLSLEREAELSEGEALVSTQLQKSKLLESKGICLLRLKVSYSGFYLILSTCPTSTQGMSFHVGTGIPVEDSHIMTELFEMHCSNLSLHVSGWALLSISTHQQRTPGFWWPFPDPL